MAAWTALLRRHGGVLVACMLIQALLGWVAVRVYVVEQNNLAANGRWTVTKTELEKGLMGAFSFLTGSQALAGGELHLDAWHGHQEVVSRDELEAPRALEFDLVLGEGGWVAAFVNRDGERPYEALRLSTHWKIDNAFLRVGEDGEFRQRAALTLRQMAPDRRYRVRLEVGSDSLSAFLDGKLLGTLPATPRPRQRIGFRGGHYPVAIDNVVVEGEGGRLLVDDFEGSRYRNALAAIVAGSLAALTLCAFVILARFVPSPRRLAFGFLTASLTLLVCAALVFAFVRQRVTWYPGQQRVLEEREEYFRKGEQERVVDELLTEFADSTGPRARRILFVGSSQTWGAGARHAEDTFVDRLETELNRRSRNQPYLCLNLGVSSARARDLEPVVKQIVRRTKPRLVLINLSSNDRATASFDRWIRKMAGHAMAVGARPVLVLEANSPYLMQGGVQARHAQMREVAAELDLPVLDLHGHLAGLSNTGFVWWDHVHLTSYGHRLAAEKLLEEIRPLLGQQAPERKDKKPALERAGS